jgi:endonuclease YncB( thermonuclease family)
MGRARKFRDGLLAVVLFGGLVAIAWYSRDSFGPRTELPAAGQAVRVIDGDSIRIGSTMIRLQGIDAPEGEQRCTRNSGVEWPCGQEAQSALRRLAQAPGLVCTSRERDRYYRHIATCRTDGEADLGQHMLEQGWAIALSYDSVAGYQAAEQAARSARRGIWQGSFERPSDWRTANPDPRNGQPNS